jgi:hypothetical protein
MLQEGGEAETGSAAVLQSHRFPFSVCAAFAMLAGMLLVVCCGLVVLAGGHMLAAAPSA